MTLIISRIVARYGRLQGVVAAVALIAALAGCAETGQAASGSGGGSRYVSGDGTVTQVGADARRPAPEVAGATLEGTRFDLAEHRGEVVVVNVWGSWCPPCRAEAPALERVWRANRSRAVQLVGIAVRETSRDAPRAFERTFGITYPSIYDPDSTLLLGFRDTLPANAVPSTLVIDREGRVAARVLGEVSESTLSGLVDDVLAEAAP